MSVVTTLQKNRAKGIEQETLTLISETFRRTFAGLTFADQLDRQGATALLKSPTRTASMANIFSCAFRKFFV